MGIETGNEGFPFFANTLLQSDQQIQPFSKIKLGNYVAMPK